MRVVILILTYYRVTACIYLLRKGSLVRILFIILLIAVFSASVSAQDFTCTADDVDFAVNAVMIELSLIKEYARIDQMPTAIEMLVTVQQELTALKSACRGESSEADPVSQDLSFGGSGSQVVGPVTIPAGLYRVSGNFYGGQNVSGTLRVERISGTCGDDFGGDVTVIFLVDTGRVQDTFRSSECVALINVQGNAHWDIVFELIS